MTSNEGSSISLRDYQIEAVDAVGEAVAGGLRRPVVVLPTGAGKTVIFAEIARRRLERPSPAGARTVVLVHRDELARQAAGKIQTHLPNGGSVGIVKAERNDIGASVVVASVATLARSQRLEALVSSGGIGTVIVDECHHATANTYRNVLEALGCMSHDPGCAQAVGFTATMARGDGTRLGEVWQEIVYTRDIPWMIRRGWLADVAGIKVTVDDLDLSRVRRTAGDYSEADMGEAILASSSPAETARAYLEHAAGRPGILFAPTVEVAHLFTHALQAVGVRACAVYGAMPTDERRAVLADYEAGHVDVLCNCMVLTEGFDSPRAEVAIIARPTTSAPLYVQMVGRVLRPFPGKLRALVLDMVGASAVHRLATLATLAGTRVEIKDGQGLLEAIDAEQLDTPERKPVTFAEGETVTEEVDLFHGSRIAWQQTDDGYWFIGAGDRYIAIVPSIEPGEHDVCWYGAKGKGGGWLRRDVPDLTLAMSVAESEVTDDEHVIVMRERSWRNRRASVKTLALATRLHIDVESLPNRKGGTVSSAITRKLASRRMDGPLNAHLRNLAASHGVTVGAQR
jgi:superfamily II DNA or RNA helicase